MNGYPGKLCGTIVLVCIDCIYYKKASVSRAFISAPGSPEVATYRLYQTNPCRSRFSSETIRRDSQTCRVITWLCPEDTIGSGERFEPAFEGPGRTLILLESQPRESCVSPDSSGTVVFAAIANMRAGPFTDSQCNLATMSAL